MMIFHYTSAGQIFTQRSRIFFTTVFLYFQSSNLLLYSVNPELLIHRVKTNKKGSKGWDRILMRLTNLISIILIPSFAGLSIRHQTQINSKIITITGYILFLSGSTLINWAMLENKHFEPTVRIQKDRNHQVISTGPYALIRHPGYLAGILWNTSMPLILGSQIALYGLIMYLILIILRTYLEDETLKKELDGYKEYTTQVRYRLIPGIW